MSNNIGNDELRAREIGRVESLLAVVKQDIVELERNTRGLASDTEAAQVGAHNLRQSKHYLLELEEELEILQTQEFEAVAQTRALGVPTNDLAVVIGHTRRKPGATGKFPGLSSADRSEYHWNTELAQFIVEEASSRNLSCKSFTRDRGGITGAYNRVRKWFPKATLELHFNNGGGAASGTETLWHFAESKSWASKLQEKINGLFQSASASEGVRWGERWDSLPEIKSEGTRGWYSLSKLSPRDGQGPSALIEPFFGDHESDARIGHTYKKQLARAIVDAYVDYFGIDTGGIGNGQGDTTGGGASAATPAQPDYFSDEFYALLLAYAAVEQPPANISHVAPDQWSDLRDLSFAQWALETGYGKGPSTVREGGRERPLTTEERLKRTELPRLHKNFGGQKFDLDLEGALTAEEFKHFKPKINSVVYTDWRGRTDNYCKFDTYADFIEFYWARFDVKRAIYGDWKNHLASGESFIRFIGPKYAPSSDGNRNYETTVLSVLRRLKEKGHVPSAVTLSANPAEDRIGGGDGDPFDQPTVAMEAAKKIVPRLDQLLALLGTTKTASEAAKASGVLPEAVNTAIDQFMTAEGEFAPVIKTLKGKLETAAVVRSLPDIVQATNPKSHKLFIQLATLLQNKEIENAEINYVILAHWALMTGWGNEGDLGKVHFNFAGIKWRESLTGYASETDYKGEKFCRFYSLQKFLDAYWLDLAPADALSTRSASEVLEVLAPDNAAKIQEIAKRIAMAATNKSSRPSTVVDLKEQGGLADTSVSDRLTNGVPTTGFAIHVKRHRVDKRHGLVRTVGDYECYLNGEKLTDPLLSGQIAEQKGPGKNYHPAKNLRVEEGTYPLGTQAGSKYKTHNYRTAGRPRPGVLLGQEDQYLVHPSNRGKRNVARQAILLHPASGFLSSAGCLNFTRPLASSRSNIDWNDSFGRTVAFINAMKEHLSDFPSKNGRTIRNAVIVIEGEPGGRTRSLLEAQSRSLGGGPGRFSISDDVLARLRPRELFEVIADAVSGEVLPDIVDREIVERALRIGKFSRRAFDWFSSTRDIDELTSDGGQTLWFPWAFGWERSATEDNSDLRKRAQAELTLVAERLLTLGVDINSPDQFQTPLTMASAYGMSAAVIRLIELGARIDAYDSQGNTALITAAHFGHLKTVAALLARGANPTLRSMTEADRAVSRSVDGVPVSETEIYVEEPPAGATALEAAEAQRAQFKELLDEGVHAVSIHVEDFNSVIAKLEGTAARP